MKDLLECALIGEGDVALGLRLHGLKNFDAVEMAYLARNSRVGIASRSGGN